MTPRPRLMYLHRLTVRGKCYWYFRRTRKSKLVRLPDDYGSPGFMRAYGAALAGEPVPETKTHAGTLSWLVARYQESVAWERLSEATRDNRRNIYRAAIRKAGDVPLRNIDADVIRRAMAAREATPFAANSFLKAMRAMFVWAKKADLVGSDPTGGVQGYPSKTEGHHTWTEEEIAQFESHWPIGTRQRLALALLKDTGLRRGDIVRLGRQHVKEGIVRLRTEKNGIEVTLPILPEMAAVINASPTSELAFICGEGGRPMTKESFGNWFAEACKAAGVTGRAHGLRKAFAVRGVEAGWTGEQLNAAMGHEFGSKESAVYIKKANRARMSKAAMAKLKR